MFRHFHKHTHTENNTNFEAIAKNILDEIIKAGSIHLRGKISLIGPVVNLDTAIKHFSQALNTVFTNNSFSHDDYQKLCDPAKESMRMKVAQHFIKKYGSSNNFYSLLYLKYHHYKKNYFEGIYLLGSIFGVRLTATDANIKNTLVKEINTSLEQPIADLLHEKRLLALAIGYTDRHSIFSHLPKELVEYIGSATNAVHFQHKK